MKDWTHQNSYAKHMCTLLYLVHNDLKFNVDTILHCKLSAGGTGKSMDWNLSPHEEYGTNPCYFVVVRLIVTKGLNGGSMEPSPDLPHAIFLDISS